MNLLNFNLVSFFLRCNLKYLDWCKYRVHRCVLVKFYICVQDIRVHEDELFTVYSECKFSSMASGVAIVLLLLLLLYAMDVSSHRPFLPGTSLEPAVIPTARASSFTSHTVVFSVLCDFIIIITIIIIIIIIVVVVFVVSPFIPVGKSFVILNNFYSDPI